MGMTAATLARESVRRAELVIAAELLCAAQAIDMTDGEPGVGTARIVTAVRERVAPLMEDRPPGPDIESVRELLASGEFLRRVAA